MTSKKALFLAAVISSTITAGILGYWYLACEGGRLTADPVAAVAGFPAEDHVFLFLTGFVGMKFDELNMLVYDGNKSIVSSFDRPIALNGGTAKANRCNPPLVDCSLTVPPPGQFGEVNMTIDLYYSDTWLAHGKWRLEVYRTYFCGTELQGGTEFP